MAFRLSLFAALALWLAVGFAVSDALSSVAAEAPASAILTPADPPEPRVNGPTVFGVRPGSPLLYTIPATGDRPMLFSVKALPAGLSVDSSTGRITGALKIPGEYRVVLSASNARGVGQKKFRIVVGERIALTPPLGWNSWNCWARNVSQEKVLQSAKAMVSSGLINHGWTYINIDDTWQGKRGGAFNALQGNEKFPNLKALVDEIHGMGLKIGLYSTPWMTSYCHCAGGSSDNEKGEWSQERKSAVGKFSFAEADARQWADWGIDYLKYDWKPIDLPHVEEMSAALHRTGRDIVFSLSNSAPYTNAADWVRLAECWRTTGDIFAEWDERKEKPNGGAYSVTELGFSQERWAPFAGPGHWNDPDMLVVGKVGWGEPHETPLTADEQYSHISLWCLLSAPLLLGCNMEHLTPFTIALLSNDEVLAVNQDALGRQAVRVAAIGPVDVYTKTLEDGSCAIGFFNRGDQEHSYAFQKLRDIGFCGKQRVRDLWRQSDLPPIDGGIKIIVPAHGVCLYKLTPEK